MGKKRLSFLLVDGYNVIWDRLRETAEENLEEARDALLSILCDYQGYVEDTIIVVFDAHKVKGNLGSSFAYKNIYVVYTKEAETADHYIERTVSRIVRDYNVSVATSDGLEQIIILAQGAVRISSRELFSRIEAKKKAAEEQFLKKNLLKENLLFDNIDSTTAEMLERMRRL